MKTAILTVLLLTISCISLAGQINSATVSGIVVDGSGMVRVSLTGGTDVHPQGECSCSSNNRQYVFDISSPPGSAWYSGFLSAMATKNKVNVLGAGHSCLQLWGTNSFEKVSSIYLLPN